MGVPAQVLRARCTEARAAGTEQGPGCAASRTANLGSEVHGLVSVLLNAVPVREVSV